MAAVLLVLLPSPGILQLAVLVYCFILSNGCWCLLPAVIGLLSSLGSATGGLVYCYHLLALLPAVLIVLFPSPGGVGCGCGFTP